MCLSVVCVVKARAIKHVVVGSTFFSLISRVLSRPQFTAFVIFEQFASSLRSESFYFDVLSKCKNVQMLFPSPLFLCVRLCVFILFKTPMAGQYQLQLCTFPGRVMWIPFLRSYRGARKTFEGLHIGKGDGERTRSHVSTAHLEQPLLT